MAVFLSKTVVEEWILRKFQYVLKEDDVVELLRDDANEYIFPWGLNRGKKLGDIHDRGYLEWCVTRLPDDRLPSHVRDAMRYKINLLPPRKQ